MTRYTTIPYTDAQVKDFAALTETGVASARVMWEKYALSEYRPLMDAPLVGSGEKAKYKWDASARLWVLTRTSRKIPALEMRNKAIEPFIQNVKAYMRGLSETLRTGKMSLLEWQSLMMQATKDSQVAAALIANGGARNAGQEDTDYIAILILLILLALVAFAADIASGGQLLNGTILSRTDLYAEAARDAYEEMERYEAENYLGKTQERRVLNPLANHCHTVDDFIGCPELAARGWVKIGTLPRLMDTPCRSKCKCHFLFR